MLRIRWLGVAGAAVLIGTLGTAALTSVQRAGLEAAVRRLDREEALIALLDSRLREATRAAMNLKIPGHDRELFSETVRVRDLSGPEGAASVAGGGMKRQFTVAGWASISRERLDLWRPLFASIDYLDHAQFSVVRGWHPASEEGDFTTEVNFRAGAAMVDGDKGAIRARLIFRWRQSSPDRPWTIESFETQELNLYTQPDPDFAPALFRMLDAPALERARRSVHEDHVRDLLEDPKKFEPPHPRFSAMSMDRHPGVAVADVDRDGLDDIYVMSRWGRNQLLRNRGDGSFQEIAARVGLDIAGFTSSAVFADFDNDGDLDAFLGRTLERSLYLENREGRFVDRSDSFEVPLPYHVSSVSAVDFNSDGLLDVYFATYWAEGSYARTPEQCEKAVDRDFHPYFSTDEAKALCGRLSDPDHHSIRNRAGPPNRLFVNRGEGRFATPENASGLALFRNTYQCAWSDFDFDGDPDVYCANDFAPNNLFRNDGAGRFSDVTEATGTADPGVFSMSVSWGDYDNDGRLDLYVANMQSKAGARVTASIPGLDPSFARMAQGSSLFHNEGDRFRRIEEGNLQSRAVMRAGWSWGAQFVDFDNDADLDIYALNGYYTAPAPYAEPVDT